MGGEHSSGAVAGRYTPGSSPRGRGTLRIDYRKNTAHRFIPAWAGNTSRNAADTHPCAVHPRVGGEHPPDRRYPHAPVGSSPRGRGTLSLDRPGAVRVRFIPAWAGNTIDPRNAAVITAIHPRVGGEHVQTIKRHPNSAGSSPRGRGTRPRHRRAGWWPRFIPAWAGNTPAAAHGRPRRPVHPRVGGEHCAVWGVAIGCAGSSPRGRGTPGKEAV